MLVYRPGVQEVGQTERAPQVIGITCIGPKPAEVMDVKKPTGRPCIAGIMSSDVIGITGAPHPQGLPPGGLQMVTIIPWVTNACTDDIRRHISRCTPPPRHGPHARRGFFARAACEMDARDAGGVS